MTKTTTLLDIIPEQDDNEPTFVHNQVKIIVFTKGNITLKMIVAPMLRAHLAFSKKIYPQLLGQE